MCSQLMYDSFNVITLTQICQYQTILYVMYLTSAFLLIVIIWLLWSSSFCQKVITICSFHSFTLLWVYVIQCNGSKHVNNKLKKQKKTRLSLKQQESKQKSYSSCSTQLPLITLENKTHFYHLDIFSNRCQFLKENICTDELK